MVSIEVFKNLHVGLPKENNAFWNIINTRSAFVLDPDTPVQSSGLQIVTFDRNVIFRRKVGIDHLITEDIDGDIVVSAPWREEDILNGVYQDESSAVLGKNNIVLAFSYQGNSADPICAKPLLFMRSILERQFPDRTITMENSSLSLEDVSDIQVRDTLTSPLVTIRAGRKLIAFDTQKNASGVYQFFHVIFDYDTVTYDKYLQPEYHKFDAEGNAIAIHSPSGINTEGSTYSREQLITEAVFLFSQYFEKYLPGETLQVTGYNV